MNPADGRISARGYIAACAIGIGSSWNIANVGPAADLMADHYGIAIAAVGLFTTMVFAGEFVAMATIGRLLAMISAKQLGVISLVVCIAGNLASLADGDVEVVLALRLLIGIGVGLGFVCGTVYVQQLGGTALHQGVYGGVSLAAGGSAVAIVPVLTSELDWTAPFVFAAAAGAVSLAPALAGTSVDRMPLQREAAFVRLLANWRLIRFALVHAASFGLSIVLSNWVVTILTGKGDYSESAAGAVGAVILVLGILSRPGGGLLVHLRPQRARELLVAMAVAGACGSLLLGLAPALPLALLATTMIGIASGAPFGPLVSGIGRTFPMSPGAAFGAMNMLALVVITLGTPLIGLTFDMPGEGLIGFAAAAGLWVVAGLALPTKAMLDPPEADSR